ncbi:hypothetical protein TNIN_95761 [Trichonephila inaurata madagascariensis]|uniref:Uncharacterized protein n=1 Tax=Trichonephila inaurata madagascariensis TaxID=2747483 RepID=A0A8X6X7B7_9ARAC|nr:hypothetical protein TNIN_95761 [Trichonephila inaurata madagascariensis]
MMVAKSEERPQTGTAETDQKIRRLTAENDQQTKLLAAMTDERIRLLTPENNEYTKLMVPKCIWGKQTSLRIKQKKSLILLKMTLLLLEKAAFKKY